MLTLNDIINVSFRKSNFSGYRTDDVDVFIDSVKDAYETLTNKTIAQKEQIESLLDEKTNLTKKIDVLADKIEQYRTEEDEIKNALVSAQKLGDASVREARHKAEIILKDASLKADRMLTSARDEIEKQEKELENLKKRVTDFRTKLLEIYKEHLTVIDAIPVQKEVKSANSLFEAPASPVVELTSEVNVAVNGAHYAEEIFPIDEPTQEFSVEAARFEKQMEASNRDLRYDVLQFDDEYDVSDVELPPSGIYNK